MSMTNFDFYKIYLVKNLNKLVNTAKNDLLTELEIHATDPTIRMRRFRMLKQLIQFESQMIEKIWRFETDDYQDLISWQAITEIQIVISRDA